MISKMSLSNPHDHKIKVKLDILQFNNFTMTKYNKNFN